MPVWEALWVFMVWSFYVLAWIGALILIFAVAIGIAGGVKRSFPRKPPRDHDPMI